MPRVKPLGNGPRKTPAMRREEFNTVIRIAMAEQGIRSQSQLAQLMGKERLYVNRRFTGVVDWDLPDVFCLIDVLKIRADLVIRMMGGAA